jgi:tetratricopeptide (TPR) repeat protein
MLGELLAQTGNHENARSGFDRALQILDELIAHDAENSDYLRARAEKRILLASVLRALGDADAELNSYDASVADYVHIDQQRPGVPVIRQQLAICLTDKGNLLQHLQRSREAEQPLLDAIVVMDELVTAHGRPEYHEQLAAARALLGEVYRDLGKYDESQQLLRSAVATYEQLVEAAPNVLDYVEREAVTRGQLGQTLAASDQAESATNELRAAANAFDSLLDLAPGTPRYLNAAAYTNWNLGETTMFKSPETAAAAFKQAVDLWGSLVGPTPSPEHLNSFAWFFVTCADADWQNGERATRLAERAVKLQQTNAHYRATLGGAYLRHGDLASCEKTLSSLVLDGHTTGAGRFFLAMSLAKQKKLAEARQHYDAGVAWMLENQPGNRQLQRLQQEALTVIEAADVASSP